MKVNVANINKGLDNNYYAHWYNDNGVACVESDPDCVYLESELHTTLKSGGFLFSLQRFDLKIRMRLSHSNFKRSIPQRRSVPDTRCF